MHAVRLHSFGPAENLRFESVPDPAPGPGAVRIAVAAAGVHLVDTTLPEGKPGPMPPPPPLPTIPGREVAGVVDSLGPGVAPEWLGVPVVAHLGPVPGGYAPRAVTGVERLHRLPAGADPAEAVALIGTGRTAAGILQFAEFGPGTVVLVTAAAGGLGNLLVQAARKSGATVAGLAGGPAKVAAVRALGADIAVDYRGDGAGDDRDGRARALTGYPPVTTAKAKPSQPLPPTVCTTVASRLGSAASRSTSSRLACTTGSSECSSARAPSRTTLSTTITEPGRVSRSAHST